MDDKRAYFRSAGNEVANWWVPSDSHAAPQYERGNRIVEALAIELGADALILDAACGKGRASASLFGRCQTIALDIAPEMLAAFDPEIARACVRVAGDVESLPFPDRSFDAIVCLEALVHFDNPARVFAEFGRVLKPGGRLLISYDNKWGLLRLAKNVLNWMISLFCRDFRLERNRRKRMFAPRSNSEVLHQLARSGFDVEHCTFVGVIMPFAIGKQVLFSPKAYKATSPLLEPLDRIAGLRRLATYVYITARCPTRITEMTPIRR